MSSLTRGLSESSALVAALKAYLEAIRDRPWDPAHSTPYLRGRALGRLYIERDVVEVDEPPDAGASARGTADVRSRTEEPEFWRDWSEVYRETERILVEGEPGQGKSTLLQMTASRLAVDQLDRVERGAAPEELRLPIVFDLEAVLKAGDLRKAIRSSVEEPLLARRISEATVNRVGPFLDDALSQGRLALHLDTLDQIRELRRLATLLAPLNQSACRLVITTRPGEGWRQLAALHFERFRLAPLTPAKREWFIDAWEAQSRGGLEARVGALRAGQHPFSGLADNPLILTLLCARLETAELPESLTRTVLYEHLVEGILNGDWQEDPGPTPVSIEVLHERLILIACQLFLKRPEETTYSLKDWLSACRAAELDAEEAKRTYQLLEHRGLLVVPSDREWRFLHRTFFEFFLAEALGECLNERGTPVDWEYVDRKAWDPAFEQIIVFLTGLLDDPLHLLRLLAEEANDDYPRHRLALAGLCLPELNWAKPRCGEELEAWQAMADEITTALFGKWRALRERKLTGTAEHVVRILPALFVSMGRYASDGRALSLAEWLDRQVRRNDVTRNQLNELRDFLRAVGLAAALPEIIRSLRERVEGWKQEPGTNPSAERRSLWARMAATMLGHLGPACATAEVTASLTDAFCHSDDFRVRSTAVVALGHLQRIDLRSNPGLYDALLEAISKPETGGLGPQAAETLGRLAATAGRPFREDVGRSLEERLSLLVGVGEADVDPARRDEQARRYARVLLRLGRAAYSPTLQKLLLDWLDRQEPTRKDQRLLWGDYLSTVPRVGELSDYLDANATSRQTALSRLHPAAQLLGRWSRRGFDGGTSIADMLTQQISERGEPALSFYEWQIVFAMRRLDLFPQLARALIRVVDGEREEDRWRAAWALSYLGSSFVRTPVEEDVMKAMLRLLGRDDDIRQPAAVLVLGGMRRAKNSVSAATDLLRLAQRAAGRGVGELAIDALGRMMPADHLEARPWLESLLESEEPRTRYAGAIALASVLALHEGRSAPVDPYRVAIALLDAVASASDDLASRAGQALLSISRWIDGDQLAPWLETPILRAGEPVRQRELVQLIAGLGQRQFPRLVDHLLEAMDRGGDLSTRSGAVQAMQLMHSRGWRICRRRGGGWESRSVRELAKVARVPIGKAVPRAQAALGRHIMFELYREQYDADDEARSDFLEAMENGLAGLSTHRPEAMFLIALALAEIRRQGSQTTVSLTIADDPPVAYENPQRKLLEGIRKTHPVSLAHPDQERFTRFLNHELDEVPTTIVRATAGGAIPILRGADATYILAGLRDADAPVYELHLAAASGLSGEQDEWLDPSMIVASEVAEEILLLRADRSRFLLPQFGADSIEALPPEQSAEDWVRRLNRKARNPAVERYRRWNDADGGRYPASNQHTEFPARLCRLGEDEIHVERRRKLGGSLRHRNRGLVVIDPAIGAIDLIGAVELEPGCPLSELILVDGELGFKQGVPDQLLDRPIFAFTPTEFAKLLYEDAPVRAACAFHGGEALGPALLPPRCGLVPPLMQAACAVLQIADKQVADKYCNREILREGRGRIQGVILERTGKELQM